MKPSSIVRCIAILVLLSSPLLDSHGADVVWTNLAGGDWTRAANWSPNQVPGVGDQAVITNAGTYTVIVSAPANPAGLLLGGAAGTQILSNLSFTLTLAGPSSVKPNGILALAGGSVLAGDGDLTVEGRLDWTGGIMQGTGKTIIVPGATLTVSGNSYNRFLYRALDLRGTGTFSGNTGLYGGFAAPFTIFSGATFDLMGDPQMPHNAGNFAVIHNFGTFRKTSGAAASSVGFVLNNHGLVQAQIGSLSFAAGGVSDGQFDAANNAVIGFSGGTHTMTNGVRFTATGSGFHRVDAGTFDVAEALTMNPILELTANGIIAGNGQLTCASVFKWTGGIMQGTGKTIILPGATLTVSGNSYNRFLYRALDLRGTGTFSGNTGLYGGFAAPFTIFDGATFELVGDQQMPHNAGNFAILQNFGTFRKTSGTTASSIGFILNNHGLVQAQSGALSFAAGGVSDGQFDAAHDAVVGFSGGTHTVTNGVRFTAAGSGFHRVDAGTFDVADALTMNPPLELTANGVITGNGHLSCASVFKWTGGIMQGAGKTIILPGATLTLSGNSYNRFLYRALDLRGIGTFSGNTGLYGGFAAPFTIFSGSTFELVGDQQMPHNAGNFAILQNFGTFRKTSGAAASSVGFVLNNHGLVQAQSGSLSFAAGGISDGQFDAAHNAVVSFNGGTHTMTNGALFTASGSGFHRVDAGTFEVAEALTMNPILELTANGVITGNGHLACASVFKWTGGTMQGAGKTIILPGATLTVSGNSYNRFLYRALDLRGTGTFSGNTGLYGGFAAPFTIFGGATFELVGDQQMPHNAGNFAILQNFGTLRKTSGAAGSSVGFVLNNHGLVQAQSGSLSFAAGGVSDGRFDAAHNAVVSFSGGTHTMTNGVLFTATGSGFHRVEAGTLDVAAALTMNPTLELTANGVIAGDSHLMCASVFKWTGGTMQGAGKTIILPGATLTVSGNSYNRFLYRALDLRGTGTFSGNTGLYGGFAAPFTIFSGATFELVGDQQMPHNAGNFAILQNFGTFRKTGGPGNSAIGFSVTNHATIESQSGTLAFSVSYVQNAGATVLNGGGYGGPLLDIRAGQLRGAGNISGDVRNWADVHPGAPFGFLSISNSVTQIYSNTANGRLNLQLGGLEPGISHDQIRIKGQANLAGTLNVEFLNNFIPAVGNSFTVMTYTARSGQFAGIVAPPGITLQPAYFPTHLVLNAVTVTPVAPFIITHPTSVVIKEGLTATFRVEAGGTPALNYLWQKNGVDLPNATSETLIIPNVNLTNAGAYRVLVSNLAGLTNSFSANLIVEPGFKTVEIDSGATNVLTGASFVNGLTGTIVGRDGSMRVTRDGGATWTTVDTGMTNLTDVQFVGGAIFITGGGAHTICVSYDGGLTWSAAYSGPERIQRLRFRSASEGIAVGDDGAILRWDGRQWTQEPAEIEVRLLSVDYCGDVPVAVGEGGRIYQFAGTNWVLRHTDLNLVAFNDVKFCAGGSTGVAVGTGGVTYRTTDCGLTWSLYENPAAGVTLRSIAFGDCHTWFASGDNGTLLQSTDGGQTWNPLYSGTTQHIRKIVFIDGYGYYVDDGGHLHRFIYAPIPPNLPPVVALTQPQGSLTNWACVRLPLAARAIDSNGFVSRVEFLAGTTSIDVDSQPPTWSASWTNELVGEFLVTAVATDNQGAVGVSAPIKVSFILPPLHQLIPVGFTGRGTNAGFKVCMTGEPGRQYEIFGTTNLTALPDSWVRLGLMAPNGELFGHLDREAIRWPYRFYQARQLP